MPSFVVSGDDSGTSSSSGTGTDNPVDIDSRTSSDIDDDVRDNCDDEMSTDVDENTVKSNAKTLVESMGDIFPSPYESNECGEIGEVCFDELREIMKGDTLLDQINPKMESLFGDVLGKAIYNAHIEIKKSGMIFSPSWRDGKIGGRTFGWIPRRQLLLCLHQERFARSDVAVLQAIVRNLNCVDLTIEAMKKWNLEHSYPNIVSNFKEKTFKFDSEKKRCYKCEIFVARSLATLRILRKDHEINQSLTKKVKACLTIMNAHIRPNQKELTRLNQTRPLVEITMNRRNETSDTKSGTIGSDATSDIHIDNAQYTRPRKIQKREDRDESLLVSFGIMHTQVQRLDQMMRFFQMQLQDHRGILIEEITENIEGTGRHIVYGYENIDR